MSTDDVTAVAVDVAALSLGDVGFDVNDGASISPNMGGVSGHSSNGVRP